MPINSTIKGKPLSEEPVIEAAGGGGVQADGFEVESFSDGLRERLGAVQHRIWVHWMRYLYSQCLAGMGGDLVIPYEQVSHWRRLMKLDYGELSSVEKLSDLDMANWVLEELGTVRGARVVLEVGRYSIPTTLENTDKEGAEIELTEGDLHDVY